MLDLDQVEIQHGERRVWESLTSNPLAGRPGSLQAIATLRQIESTRLPLASALALRGHMGSQSRYIGRGRDRRSAFGAGSGATSATAEPSERRGRKRSRSRDRSYKSKTQRS
jgi:hypothetical protein